MQISEKIHTLNEMKKIDEISREKQNKGIVSLRGKIVRRFIIGKHLDVGCNSHFFFEEIKTENTVGLDKFIDDRKWLESAGGGS